MIFSNASCQKNLLKESPLNGTYIESEKRTDTIVFAPEYDGQNPVFELKRGFRISDGYKLPDYFSGHYNYKISQNSISLYWFLSSGSFQTYYFNNLPAENKFEVGNFFKNPGDNTKEKDTLVFIRIK
jgi:hypothetical protein